MLTEYLVSSAHRRTFIGAHFDLCQHAFPPLRMGLESSSYIQCQSTYVKGRLGLLPLLRTSEVLSLSRCDFTSSLFNRFLSIVFLRFDLEHVVFHFKISFQYLS